jgi:hypothetical protein
MSTSLLVQIDCPEPRVRKPRQIVSADGTSWDLEASEGVWVDPVTKTLMLLPAPLSEDWTDTFTGDYYRFHKSDYTLTTSAAWKENHRGTTGNVFLENNGAVGEIVKTTASFPANTPFFVSAYISSFEKLSESAVLVCGWGTPGDADCISLRVRANGSLALYKGSTFIGSGAIEDGLTPSGSLKKTSNAVGGKVVSLLLLPMRRREIVVVTDFGTGGRILRPDLSGLATDNEITPAGPFWWQVPVGRASVQAARVFFSASGTAYGRVVPLRWPYTGTVDPAWQFVNRYDQIGEGSVPPWATVTVRDGSSGLVLNSSNAVAASSARIRVVMGATDNKTSLGIYSTDAYTGPTTTTTANAPFDLTPHFTSLTVSVPEFGAATATIEAVSPGALAAAGLASPEGTFPRPFRIAIGGQDLIRGELQPPTEEYLSGSAGTRADALIWSGADREKELIDHVFTTAMPFDGALLTAAITDLIVQAGFSSGSVFTSTDSFTLPPGGPVTAGEWALMPERGQSLAEWLEKLHQEYAGDWVMGWTPTLAGYTFYFRAPGDYSATPVTQLYNSYADAAAASVASGARMRRVVRSLTSTVYPPEGNQILVVGQDTQTGRAIWSQADDAASQDPTTAPASRPNNWRGKVVTVVHESPAITTQAAADRARDFLEARLMDERIIISWTGELLRTTGASPRLVWKGDIVRIWQPGRTAYDDIRVLSITIEVVKVASDFNSFSTECRYSGIRIGGGSA